jgi:hypothetical protein
MWQTVVFGFLAGLLLGNGIPHFVKGITKENYPCMLGNSPTPNLIGGWVCFVVAGLSTRYVELQQFPDTAFVSASVGLLLIGLFHASIGAFGRTS